MLFVDIYPQKVPEASSLTGHYVEALNIVPRTDTIFAQETNLI